MARQKLSRPTDGELAILRVLWERGPSTVREVQEVMSKRDADRRDVGYTTVLKLLQIMTDKGFVDRDESSRSHIYQVRQSEDETQRQLVDDLLERAFGGSTARLVLQALHARKAGKGELDEIRRLLDDFEGGR